MAKKGVNLGGWLVLEKWMTPYLFDGCNAEDEMGLYQKLDLAIVQERYEVHRKSYITQRDFQKIAMMGLDFVRLPIPYFVFGDVAPYVGCLNYVDQAFTWANTYGLQVLLDLHTVPGGQNGLDNSGLKGICTWHTKQEYMEQTLAVITKLAKRYGKQSSLYGIEVINEPADEVFWNRIVSQAVCEDFTRQEGSSYVPTEVLKTYYSNCYAIIDQHCDPAVNMIIHDGFRVAKFHTFMKQDDYPRLIIDLHLYLNFEHYGQSDISLEEYVRILKENYHATIQETTKYHRVLIGEWSMGNHLQEQEKNNTDTIKALFLKQIQTYEESEGWCFWNYKMSSQRMFWDYELLYMMYNGKGTI